MSAIWKFPLVVLDEQTIRTHKAQPLSVGVQEGMLTMWALVDPMGSEADQG